MSSDTDPVHRVLGQERLRAASTVVLGVAALSLLLVLVKLLPVPLSPAAASGTESTALGLLGVVGLGLFGYIGWGVATLVHTETSVRRTKSGDKTELVQWTAVLGVLLLAYTALGPVVMPTLGALSVVYDVVFLLVAVVPVVAVATRLSSSGSGENSFADKIEAIREDLNPRSSPDPDVDED